MSQLSAFFALVVIALHLASALDVSVKRDTPLAVPLEKYNVNASLVSVSGVSAGGYMAGQLHVAYSKIFKGAGIYAAGPYFCANANIGIALTACMRFPQLIILEELFIATDEAATLNLIDPLSELADQRVWLFGGSIDSVVVPGVMRHLFDFYNHYVTQDPQTNIKYISNIAAEHSWVSPKGNNTCGHMGSPYVNNCDNVDYPGQMLQHLYPELKFNNKTAAKDANLMEFDQLEFIPGGVSADTASIDSIGYIYVPTSCKRQSICSLQIVFHGCWQSRTDVKDVFVRTAGLNEWAEANRMILVYPQAKPNLENPRGCWDWWGYTGINYATRDGTQMKFVKNILDRITGK